MIHLFNVISFPKGWSSILRLEHSLHLKQYIEDHLQLDKLFDQPCLVVGSPEEVLCGGGFTFPSPKDVLSY